MAKGKVSKKEVENIAKKDRKKKLAEQTALEKIQVKCNHVDKDSGKSKLKESKNDESKSRCKICSLEIYTDPNIINEKNIKESSLIDISTIDIIRHNLPIGDKFDDKLKTTKEVLMKLPELFHDMEELERKKNKKHKNSGKGNNKNKNKKKRRW